MKLKELLKGIAIKQVKGDLGVEITGISYDSRSVKRGDLFVCITGTKDDGHRYASEASRRGAVAFLAKREVKISSEQALILVEEPRLEMGKIADRFFDQPSKKIEVIGITGTNGKTTISYLIESISLAQNVPTGVIGTVNYRWQGKEIPAKNTTPESVEIISLLSQMQRDGIKRVVIEVSSHSLAQKRVSGIEFKAGLFTNLSPEHLDYHRDMEDYFQAKARLFTDVLAGKWLSEPVITEPISVINIDDPYGKRIFDLAVGKKISYSLKSKEANYRAEIIKLGWDGLELKVHSGDGEFAIKSSLVGRPNAMNILASSALMHELGADWEQIQKGIESLKNVPGRMEIFNSKNRFQVVVDYAHTPDALEKVLRTIREIGAQRLIVVFGCGGDRDEGKRPKMGEISATLADIAIITSDNPRSEDPLKIISQIEQGAKKVGAEKLKALGANSKGYFIEPDRRKAIEMSLNIAQKGDCVLIAGKGHEDYQIIGDRKIHFDDREEVRRILGIERRA